MEVVSRRASRRRRSPSSRADAILEIAAEGGPDFAWLDGGAGRSFVGVDADLRIESDRIEALAEIEAAWRAEPSHLWIGWLTYELGADALLGRRALPGRLPGLVFRRYRAAVEQDQGRTRWHGDGSAVAELQARLEASGREPLDRSWPWGPLEPLLPPAEHRARVVRILEHIAAGDTYQVNLSQVLRGRWKLPPVDRQGLARAVAGAYARLRTATPASMGALINAGDAWILSNSPETLLDVRLDALEGDLVRTWPIKGTRPRGANPRADRSAAKELVESAKDRAEHLMIVDLLRNDLGRLAAPGTVRAPREPQLVTLPTVHHLISEVSARLRPGWSLPSLFAPYFMLMLYKKLQEPGMQRNEQEARTLCEMRGALLEGRTMQAMMFGLGKLKAFEASLDSDAGGWGTARQLEMAARPGQGLVTGLDRMLAIQDKRDEQRGSGRLPTRQDRGGGGRRQYLRHE